ncbi:hypothetical protein SAMD00023353_4000350 [Rosellinia necatrix]|uniref:Uncharacterized protein n=1 Tax=Rosellinia necatrix TaxID=77044 RepID=A0A1S8A991_ROSNE|nr:hypothetical protein SAMD00023353_4000350 [Rosellinia necatrix]
MPLRPPRLIGGEEVRVLDTPRVRSIPIPPPPGCHAARRWRNAMRVPAVPKGGSTRIYPAAFTPYVDTRHSSYLG